MKYILVTGGVISGIGKGIIASSVGTILKSCGLHVTSIKIDPYINIDAGTFSPYEHGKQSNNHLPHLSFLKNCQVVYPSVSWKHNVHGSCRSPMPGKALRCDVPTFSLGSCFFFPVVPHITDAIQEWVMRQALIPVDEDGLEPQVCVIELGGTVGDIESMPFIEAFRQFQFKVKRENFCNIHVSLVPQVSHLQSDFGGEKVDFHTLSNSFQYLSTHPVQLHIMYNHKNGKLLSMHFLFLLNHILFLKQVICVHDVSSIYRVPLLLEEQGVVDYFLRRLDLPIERQPRKMLMKWKEMADRYDRLLETCSIALVGKYTKFSDSYASVIKALEHSALAINHKLDIKYIDSTDLEPSTLQEEPVRYHEAWQKLCSAHGVLVPGGFGVRGTEGKIQAIAWARKQKKPFLGVCLGMQLAVVEFSRNVLGWSDANSTEFDPKTSHPVVIDMPEHNPGQMGGTMRLGKRRTLFQTKNSVMRKLYGDPDYLEERHRHRFEVNPVLKKCLEEQGLKFVGQDVEGERMEIVELEDHPFFVGVQYHPEFLSRPIKPSPPYFGLLLASVGRLPHYLQKGCRLSPRDTYSDRSGSSSPDSEITELKFPSINHD
uniref:CTP synthase 1 n=1 Tax=Ictidomys tridecemlineatus TaxID=43179 RepID=UPI001A9D0D7C|nr:CTP synthase 1 [Ictidomys tridecemlineatus]